MLWCHMGSSIHSQRHTHWWDKPYIVSLTIIYSNNDRASTRGRGWSATVSVQQFSSAAKGQGSLGKHRFHWSYGMRINIIHMQLPAKNYNLIIKELYYNKYYTQGRITFGPDGTRRVNRIIVLSYQPHQEGKVGLKLAISLDFTLLPH